MNIQKIGNQQNFTAVSIIQKGNAEGRSYFIEKHPSLLKEIDKAKRDVFVKEVVKPAENLETEICVDCNDNSITLFPKDTFYMTLDSKSMAVVSPKDERIVRYPIENDKKVNVMYESTEIATDKAWEYNFGDPLIDRAKAAVEIAKTIEK